MKKILILLLATTLIWSCKEKIGKVQNATKTVIFPGIPRAKIEIQYTANVTLFKDIRLVEIKVKRNNEEEKKNKNISIINAKSGKIMKTDALLPAGDYFMEARIPFEKKYEETKDKLIIILLCTS